MRACTARRSGASGMHTRRYVRVYTILGLGMRQQRRYWEQNGHSGALRRYGRYSGLMRRKAEIRVETEDTGTQNKKLLRSLDAFSSDITDFRKENAGVKNNANPRSMIASLEDSGSDAVYN